jgi:hypothetical protein
MKNYTYKIVKVHVYKLFSLNFLEIMLLYYSILVLNALNQYFNKFIVSMTRFLCPPFFVVVVPDFSFVVVFPPNAIEFFAPIYFPIATSRAIIVNCCCFIRLSCQFCCCVAFSVAVMLCYWCLYCCVVILGRLSTFLRRIFSFFIIAIDTVMIGIVFRFV